MATGLTKKQKEALTDKITGLIKNSPALRMTLDSSVNEMNINQISGELNRIHHRAIGKDLPTEINIPVKQLGSGDPSPNNIRPIVGYEIDGIGTVYSGELNIETGVLTINMAGITLDVIINWGASTPSSGVWRGTLGAVISNIKYPEASEIPNAYSNKYIKKAYTPLVVSDNGMFGLTGSSGGRIVIVDHAYDSIEDFTNTLSNVMLVYELATPETYTLTPQQMLQLLDQI